jgi:hypothetical protein
VIKDNNKDRFFVHRSKDGGTPRTIEFYPNSAETTKSGVTTSSYLFGAITLKDTDKESLHKMVDDFPGLRSQVLGQRISTSGDRSQQAQNKAWWRNFYGSHVLTVVGSEFLLASRTVTLPARLARVIPEEFAGSPTLGRQGVEDVFVTDASQLKGLTSSTQIAERLTLKNADGTFVKGPFRIIEFDTPTSGLAQPFNRGNPGFINGGKTAGGATEYVIPNANINSLKNVTQRTIQ